MNLAAAASLQLSLRSQRLDLFDGEIVRFSCAISSSFVGVGTEAGSLRTPTGNFAIAEKIGAGEPLGTVFRGRQSTGESADSLSPDDQITTRILWLRGLDSENANTQARYIYLHGTNHEKQLGLPMSHGCIRLANTAMADLFDLVEVDMLVAIHFYGYGKGFAQRHRAHRDEG